MDLIISAIPLLIFALLLFFIFRSSRPNQKALMEATEKATESYERLAEAINRLANVIAQK